MAGFDVVTVRSTLTNLMQECDSVLKDLQRAHVVEIADTATSNNSIVGGVISLASNFENHNVADRVNQLQRNVFNAQQVLNPQGIILTSISDGGQIRRSEDAEHSFWGNVVAGDAYTTLASHNTANLLSSKISEVTVLKNQIQTYLYTLQATPPSIDPFSTQYSNLLPSDFTITDSRNTFSDYRPYRSYIPQHQSDPCCVVVTAIGCLILFCAIVSTSNPTFNI